ncbi:MAG TPA: hypothetical protein VGM24_10410, partial [Puia sp.]
MHKKKLYFSRTIQATAIIVFLVFLLTQCVSKNKSPAYIVQNPDYSLFAGSVTCVRCHKDIYDTHIHTAHFLTSQPASADHILGSFDAGKNRFSFADHKAVIMEKRNDGFYQVEYDSGVQKTARRFDISIGSGTKGQSYLYWMNDQLFQLPIGYYTPTGQWSNSPGYPDQVIFNRQVGS